MVSIDPSQKLRINRSPRSALINSDEEEALGACVLVTFIWILKNSYNKVTGFLSNPTTRFLTTFRKFLSKYFVVYGIAKGYGIWNPLRLLNICMESATSSYKLLRLFQNFQRGIVSKISK